MDILNGVALESKPCPLGCETDDEFILTGRDRLFNLPGEFTVVRCKGCGLMRTNPRPTPKTIGFYYPDNYGPYLDTKVTVNESIPLWKQLFGKAFQFNMTRLPLLKIGRMLEIGCAAGSFMHKMAKEGWEVEGIEFSPKAAENARALGYRVHTGSVETAHEPQQPFNLVAGWMVLEHLHEPILTLQKLHRWTYPDAWLVLSVPNMDCLGFYIFKDAWYALHLPHHLYHYTPKTLRLVLEQGGWQIINVFHQRILNDLIASTGYFLQDRGFKNKLTQAFINYPKKAGWKSSLLYPFAYILSLFSQTGTMTVWARKLNDYRKTQ